MLWYGQNATEKTCVFGLNTRTSRCVQNLVRQRAPFKCMGFWYIRSRISAAEFTPKTRQNYSKCHLRQHTPEHTWGSHGAGMAFITYPWLKHSDRTLFQPPMNHVGPDQPPSFAIPPRTSPVNPVLTLLDNDCATSTTYTVMKTISPQINSIPMGNISPICICLQGECFPMHDVRLETEVKCNL